jgi:ComF family protein
LPLPTDAVAACADCGRLPPPWQSATCAVDYAHPWDALVSRLKFQARPALAAPIAGLMAEAIGSPGPIDLVLPVPLSSARLAERGYNQAWEIARRLAPRFRLAAAADLLHKLVDAAHQSGLKRAERERNLRGAFMVEPGQRARIAGRRIALVDDVLTTGATARACTEALQRAGAASVAVWCFARTP